MALPYTHTLSSTITSGTPLTIECPAPYRGILTKLIVRQLSGTLAGFTVDVYDDNPDDTTDGLNSAMHKIIATRTVAAASSATADYDLVAPYENQELQDSTSKRRYGRFYIIVNVSGTGAKPFEIAYTVTSQLA